MRVTDEDVERIISTATASVSKYGPVEVGLRRIVEEIVEREQPDARRFEEKAMRMGYPLEMYRKKHDEKIKALTAAGMWPPKIALRETPLDKLAGEG